jgi:hypothetical protein
MESGFGSLDPRADAEPPGGARGSQRFQVRLTREGGIQRFELSGRFNEQWDRVPAAPGVQSDLPAQALEHGPVEVAQRTGIGGGEKRQGLVGCSGQVLGPRSIERTSRPAARIGCQCRRALREGSSRG